VYMTRPVSGHEVRVTESSHCGGRTHLGGSEGHDGDELQHDDEGYGRERERGVPVQELIFCGRGRGDRGQSDGGVAWEPSTVTWDLGKKRVRWQTWDAGSYTGWIPRRRVWVQEKRSVCLRRQPDRPGQGSQRDARRGRRQPRARDRATVAPRGDQAGFVSTSSVSRPATGLIESGG